MKKAKKGETSQAVLDAAKKAVVEKNIEKSKKEEAKKQVIESEKKEAEKETKKEVVIPVVAEEPEVKVNEDKTETPVDSEVAKERLPAGATIVANPRFSKPRTPRP